MIKPVRLLFFAALLGVVLLGFVGAWYCRHQIGPDGLSYLDLAVQFLNRGPAGLVTGLWSPLYPFLIAIGLLLTGRDPLLGYYCEHLVNWFAFVASFCTFVFFARSLMQGRAQSVWWNRGIWIALAAALFLQVNFTPAYPALVITAPDTLVSAAAFAVAGLLCRIIDEPVRRKWWIWLGAALAAGYYSKTVFFTLAPCAILVAAVAGKWSKARLRNLAWCGATWLLLCAPWVFAVSEYVGHLSFGEAGNYNYLVWVNQVRVPGADGVHPPDLAQLTYPPRVLLLEPVPIFDFRSLPYGTCPSWFDATHWAAGVPLKFDSKAIWRQVRGMTDRYEDTFRAYYWPLACGFVLLLLPGLALDGGRNLDWRRLLVLWFAISPLLLYAVINVEHRYVAPFWAIMWMVLFDAVFRVAAPRLPKYTACAGLAVLIWITIPVCRHLGPYFAVLREFPEAQGPLPYHTYAQAGLALRAAGVRPGDDVAALGDARWHLYAQPVGIRVTAQIDPENVDKFWRLGDADRKLVLATLRNAGYRALVVKQRPPTSQATEWMQLAGSDYWALLLE